MAETVKGEVKLKLMPSSVWVFTPSEGVRAEYHDGDVIEAELDSEGKPVDIDMRALVELGFAVVEG